MRQRILPTRTLQPQRERLILVSVVLAALFLALLGILCVSNVVLVAIRPRAAVFPKSVLAKVNASYQRWGHDEQIVLPPLDPRVAEVIARDRMDQGGARIPNGAPIAVLPPPPTPGGSGGVAIVPTALVLDGSAPSVTNLLPTVAPTMLSASPVVVVATEGVVQHPSVSSGPSVSSVALPPTVVPTARTRQQPAASPVTTMLPPDTATATVFVPSPTMSPTPMLIASPTPTLVPIVSSTPTPMPTDSPAPTDVPPTPLRPTRTATPVPTPLVYLMMSAEPPSGVAGSLLRYTITVLNAGPPVSLDQIDAQLPAVVQVLGADGATQVDIGGTSARWSWAAGSFVLPRGRFFRTTIYAHVLPSAAPGVYFNNVVIAGSFPGMAARSAFTVLVPTLTPTPSATPTPSNTPIVSLTPTSTSTPSVTPTRTPVRTPRLMVVIAASTTHAVVGDRVTLWISYGNFGSVAATGTVLSDSFSGACFRSVADRVIGRLNPGQTGVKVVTFTARIPGTCTNTATLRATNALPVVDQVVVSIDPLLTEAQKATRLKGDSWHTPRPLLRATPIRTALPMATLTPMPSSLPVLPSLTLTLSDAAVLRPMPTDRPPIRTPRHVPPPVPSEVPTFAPPVETAVVPLPTLVDTPLPTLMPSVPPTGVPDPSPELSPVPTLIVVPPTHPRFPPKPSLTSVPTLRATAEYRSYPVHAIDYAGRGIH